MTKAPPPPPKSAPKSAQPSNLAPASALTIEKGRIKAPSRILLYGAGGIGKTTLAAALPKPLFVDLEFGTKELEVDRVRPSSWTELRGLLSAYISTPPDGYRTIVLDSATRAEELAGEFVLRTHGTREMRSLDEIAYGKGTAMMGSEMLALIADLDRLVTSGLNVCVIAHELSATVPSPVSEDFLRAEPALYAGDKRGRNAVRNRFVQWSDSTVWLSIDRFVKEGKAQGSGTRTAYTHEAPSFIAKSRISEQEFSIDENNGAEFWKTLRVS